jgi:hypothetical protein
MRSRTALWGAVALSATLAVTTSTPTGAQTMSPQGVVVPPQDEGPMTVAAFAEAVRNQATHRARLARLTNLPPQQVTVINIANLSPSPPASTDASVTRAEGIATTRGRTLRAHSVVSDVLSRANIGVENVLALAVRGHLLNDVTLYHR